jgi:neutral ceramidase
MTRLRAALSAGAATRDISPRKPMFLFGYPHVPRTSTGLHDPLLATALYLNDGASAAIFVSVDVLMLSHTVLNACRGDIRDRTGVPESHILISTTHTHSAPVTIDLLAFRGDPVVPPADAEYLEFVSRSIVDAAAEACANALPARAAVTSAHVDGVGGNRHDPDGPRDSETGILYVCAAGSGTPLALLLVYSMHPTVLHEDSALASADFPGYARVHLSEALPGLQVLYHTGPSGNQSPRYHISGQTFAEAERLGRRLGAAVLDSVRALPDAAFWDHLPIAAARRLVELPGREFPSVEEAAASHAAALAEFERLKAEAAAHGPTRTAEVAVFGAEEQLFLARAQERGELVELRRAYTPVEVQVIRAGPAFFVGLPGELFVEYGLEIKARARGRAFVISLANGELQGYIVTPGATGYEAGFSLFAPEAGRVLVDAALQLIDELGGTTLGGTTHGNHDSAESGA